MGWAIPEGQLSPSQRSALDRRRGREANGDLTRSFAAKLRQAATHCSVPTCRAELIDVPYQPNSREIDHIVPLEYGGTHTRDNVRVVCRWCNQARCFDARHGVDTLSPDWTPPPRPFSIRPQRRVSLYKKNTRAKRCSCGKRRARRGRYLIATCRRCTWEQEQEEQERWEQEQERLEQARREWVKPIKPTRPCWSCGTPFAPQRPDQQTCGADQCQGDRRREQFTHWLYTSPSERARSRRKAYVDLRNGPRPELCPCRFCRDSRQPVG